MKSAATPSEATAATVSRAANGTSAASKSGAGSQGHQALSAYIQARFDEFSRSQKDVA